MLENAVSLFFFINRNSPLHRLDPRVKITGFILFCLASLTISSLSGQGMMLAALLTLFPVGRSSENLKKMAAFFMLIAAMTFLMWLFFYGGTEKVRLWKFIYICSGAPGYAATMSLRFLNMLLSGLLFLSVTSIEDFFGGMIIMGVPYPFAFAVSLSFRLVMVFTDNAFHIVEAQKVRGNDVTRGHLFKRIRAYLPLVAPLILTGIKKAETLTLALESKGFSPRNKIDLTGKYRLRTADKCCLLLMCPGVALILLHALNYW